MNLDNYINTGNLFNEMQKIEELPFLGSSLNSTLNAMLLVDYGDRTVYKKLAEKPLSEVAEMLVLLHGDKWKNIVTLSEKQDDLFATSKRTLTETINENENRNINRDETGKVSSFNSDELLVNDGTTTVNTENLDGEKVRTLTDESYNFNQAFNNLSLSEKSNIIKIVLKDVANFLTLSIY